MTTTRARCDCGRVRSRSAHRCTKCHQARMDSLRTEARAQVATGRCPRCGQELRRNLALAGWWQCTGYGAPTHRALGARPCSWQTFTD